MGFVNGTESETVNESLQVARYYLGLGLYLVTSVIIVFFAYSIIGWVASHMRKHPTKRALCYVQWMITALAIFILMGILMDKYNLNIMLTFEILGFVIVVVGISMKRYIDVLITSDSMFSKLEVGVWYEFMKSGVVSGEFRGIIHGCVVLKNGNRIISIPTTTAKDLIFIRVKGGLDFLE